MPWIQKQELSFFSSSFPCSFPSPFWAREMGELSSPEQISWEQVGSRVLTSPLWATQRGHINHSFTTHQFPSVTNDVYKGLKIDVSSRNMSVWHLCQPGTAQGHKSAVSTRLILLYLNFGVSFTWLCVHGTGISLSDNISYTLFISLFVLPVHPFSVTAKVWTCPRTRFLHHSPI